MPFALWKISPVGKSAAASLHELPEMRSGAAGVDVSERPGGLHHLRWEGDVPPQKWMNFYMRVLTRFATDPNLRIRVQFETEPDGGITQQQLEETKISLRELGLDDICETDPQEPDQA
jgi:hypothetical protein